MIFAYEYHIDLIRAGKKTQTRRIHRGIYKYGHDYSVQPGRGKPGVPDIRIVIDKIRQEATFISKEDAIAEGGYTPQEFERLWDDIHKDWATRWVFEFHVIKLIADVTVDIQADKPTDPFQIKYWAPRNPPWGEKKEEA